MEKKKANRPEAGPSQVDYYIDNDRDPEAVTVVAATGPPTDVVSTLRFEVRAGRYVLTSLQIAEAGATMAVGNPRTLLKHHPDGVPRQMGFLVANPHDFPGLQDLQPAGPDWPGITSTMLRNLNLFGLEKYARRHIPRTLRELGAESGRPLADFAVASERRRGRPREHTAEWLAALAVAYDNEFETNGPAKINVRLGERFSYSPTRIAELLRVAARRGLREGTQQGRAGGRATAKALALVAAGDNQPSTSPMI